MARLKKYAFVVAILVLVTVTFAQDAAGDKDARNDAMKDFEKKIKKAYEKLNDQCGNTLEELDVIKDEVLNLGSWYLKKAAIPDAKGKKKVDLLELYQIALYAVQQLKAAGRCDLPTKEELKNCNGQDACSAERWFREESQVPDEEAVNEYITEQVAKLQRVCSNKQRKEIVKNLTELKIAYENFAEGFNIPLANKDENAFENDVRVLAVNSKLGLDPEALKKCPKLSVNKKEMKEVAKCVRSGESLANCAGSSIFPPPEVDEESIEKSIRQFWSDEVEPACPQLSKKKFLESLGVLKTWAEDNESELRQLIKKTEFVTPAEDLRLFAMQKLFAGGECGKVPSEKELNKQLKSCAKGATNCKLLQWMFEESGNGDDNDEKPVPEKKIVKAVEKAIEKSCDSVDGGQVYAKLVEVKEWIEQRIDQLERQRGSDDTWIVWASEQIPDEDIRLVLLKNLEGDCERLPNVTFFNSSLNACLRDDEAPEDCEAMSWFIDQVKQQKQQEKADKKADSKLQQTLEENLSEFEAVCGKQNLTNLAESLKETKSWVEELFVELMAELDQDNSKNANKWKDWIALRVPTRDIREVIISKVLEKEECIALPENKNDLKEPLDECLKNELEPENCETLQLFLDKTEEEKAEEKTQRKLEALLPEVENVCADVDGVQLLENLRVVKEWIENYAFVEILLSEKQDWIDLIPSLHGNEDIRVLLTRKLFETEECRQLPDVAFFNSSLNTCLRDDEAPEDCEAMSWFIDQVKQQKQQEKADKKADNRFLETLEERLPEFKAICGKQKLAVLAEKLKEVKGWVEELFEELMEGLEQDNSDNGNLWKEWINERVSDKDIREVIVTKIIDTEECLPLPQNISALKEPLDDCLKNKLEPKNCEILQFFLERTEEEKAEERTQRGLEALLPEVENVCADVDGVQLLENIREVKEWIENHALAQILDSRNDDWINFVLDLEKDEDVRFSLLKNTIKNDECRQLPDVAFFNSSLNACLRDDEAPEDCEAMSWFIDQVKQQKQQEKAERKADSKLQQTLEARLPEFEAVCGKQNLSVLAQNLNDVKGWVEELFVTLMDELEQDNSDKANEWKEWIIPRVPEEDLRKLILVNIIEADECLPLPKSRDELKGLLDDCLAAAEGPEACSVLKFFLGKTREEKDENKVISKLRALSSKVEEVCGEIDDEQLLANLTSIGEAVKEVVAGIKDAALLAVIENVVAQDDDTRIILIKKLFQDDECRALPEAEEVKSMLTTCLDLELNVIVTQCPVLEWLVDSKDGLPNNATVPVKLLNLYREIQTKCKITPQEMSELKSRGGELVMWYMNKEKELNDEDVSEAISEKENGEAMLQLKINVLKALIKKKICNADDLPNEARLEAELALCERRGLTLLQCQEIQDYVAEPVEGRKE